MDSNNETMLLEYERRKETDPTFALTLDEFAVLWRAREKPQVCEHGSLKRKCLVCELLAENAILNRMLNQALHDIETLAMCFDRESYSTETMLTKYRAEAEKSDKQ